MEKKTPFNFAAGDHTYTVKKCAKFVGKDGKVYLKPIEDDDIVLAFVDERNHVLNAVDTRSNMSWVQQLLASLVLKYKRKEKSENNG